MSLSIRERCSALHDRTSVVYNMTDLGMTASPIEVRARTEGVG